MIFAVPEGDLELFVCHLSPSPTRQSSRNSSMRSVAMTIASVPEGDLELFVCHLSLVHQTVVQKLLHEVMVNDRCVCT